MNVPDDRYSIDHIRTTGNRVSISGWFLDCIGCDRLAVLCGGATLHVARPDEWRQPSADVAALSEARYGAVRFHVTFPFPGELSLAMLRIMVLSFEGDGPARVLPVQAADGTDTAAGELACVPLRDLRLGIGIPTYNRAGLVMETVRRVRDMTQFDPVILVSNDGSTDDTAPLLARIPGIHVLNAPNAGIAWNKNRLLFHLHEIEKCDVILLLEDDAQPTAYGWNIDWMLACVRYGHVNFAPPWFPRASFGNGSWHDPFHNDVLTAQCSGFSREALSYVGYIDTRFGQYGHEHVEHTSRMIRMGYGGHTKEDGASRIFYLLEGGIEIMESVSNFSQQEVDDNSAVFHRIHGECAYRPPWRDDTQIRRLRDEMRMVRRQ
ncbi:glycosyltransferase family 2 protein [Gluconacetobacter tumulisoli]|uniref:Glycosyltransferase n=1 Tax=Gluconacetobacter tumulisoli TaxID=1286189 RepID=A0A7W4K5D7_9PROT|nr:glycosyltransferase [Gluconacetobacter tumulisoli]MBB2200729.1 glycosyltransferase [Gluconacetobacter tumulisoli]